MASYFEEMGWTPLADGETPNHYWHLIRLLWDEAGESQRLPPPTSQEVIDNLPEATILKNDIQCTICLKKFEVGEKVKVLPCTHEFHAPCILPWLGKTSTCPLCRDYLKTDDEQYEEYKKAKIREKQRQEEIDALHNSMFS
ncbi:E3 ubiquitin-protein ligase RNF181-like [Cimex lectularius]|uniref:RING-type E3 ubiquitin transferase n=1 Tax=Cimex lectularius TaxID=79782 RepID=A0A8I6S409_CIMLE|nr:E3 ubiquitin-protein ligase RNF181-like [Cimex lectularius]XP_014252994.1 E3 ubiquitin-protein ligase RNF181-like [Cimex lectularius]XP_014252996.1 E3 ubiquitin-protein ligase RNF181-like [Cimex lectularius]XP_014252997.1 E3 ubiquitin-protein ligase RNF181-like [Cimex lectularius]